MPIKVMWISFLTTMVFWLGCSSQQDQNYRLLNEDPPLLQTEQRRGSTWNLALQSSAQAQTSEPAVNSSPTRRSGPTQASTVAPPGASILGEDSASLRPGINGLDRSEWPTIQVQPEAAAIRHRPTYFRNAPTSILPGSWGRKQEDLSWSTRQVQTNQAADSDSSMPPNLSAESAATALNQEVAPALTTPTKSSLSARAKNLVVEPLAFLVDLAMLPVRMVQQPPWREVGGANPTSADADATPYTMP